MINKLKDFIKRFGGIFIFFIKILGAFFSAQFWSFLLKILGG